MVDLPVFSFFQKDGLRDQLTFHQLSATLKIQVIEGALDVQWARLALKIKPQPIVHLEGKNIRCCTDFQH